jgi:predicted transcriptional regulator
MITRAASYLPEDIRANAMKVVGLEAIGHTTTEVAHELGISTPAVTHLRRQMGAAVIQLMRHDYTEVEIGRTLGLDVSTFDARYSLDDI